MQICIALSKRLTQPNAAVLQEVAEVIKHGALILAADAAEIA